jgi:malonate-semialdehyde dehydrogenase (acetylating)/methylmalonate-semialdehyde dehydrogenase
MAATKVSSLVPAYTTRGYDFAEYATARNWIGGEWRDSSTGETMPVENPRYGRAMGKVAVSPSADVHIAVQAAKAALPHWRALPMRERAQVLYRLKAILERDMEELSWLLSAENGKTYPEALGDVGKGIECVEFAASLAMGGPGAQIDVSRGVNCRMTHEPLGIVAGITPFNFPIMVPLWMIPNAIMGGNAFILKPASSVPYGGMRIAAALEEAGLPKGIFNVVYGRRDAVSAIVDHPEIAAVAFVGSTPVAKHLYGRGAALGKRMLCLGSAKNHAIVVPDADLELTASTLVASAYGCAGQRCMAATIMVAVGDVQPIVDDMVKRIQKLKLGQDMGPIITKDDEKRIVGYIDQAEKMGAKILCDGRGAKVDGCPGNWVGFTLIDNVTAEMPCAFEESFGPVFCIRHAKTLDEAIDIVNASPYGNGGAVFTQSGNVARIVGEKMDVGMFGVNIGIPVPREPFAFGGWKDSGFGCMDITGMDGFLFWTRAKKTTEKWAHQAGGSWMS